MRHYLIPLIGIVLITSVGCGYVQIKKNDTVTSLEDRPLTSFPEPGPKMKQRLSNHNPFKNFEDQKFTTDKTVTQDDNSEKQNKETDSVLPDDRDLRVKGDKSPSVDDQQETSHRESVSEGKSEPDKKRSDLSTEENDGSKNFSNNSADEFWLESLHSDLEAKGIMEIERQEEKLYVRFLDLLTFDPAEYELDLQDKTALRDFATVIVDYPLRVDVRGHTSNLKVSGQFDSREQLAAARARSVKNFLIRETDLKERNVTITGVGGKHPVVPNRTPSNREKNRRVDFKIRVDR